MRARAVKPSAADMTLVWVVDKTSFLCLVIPDKCPFCGKRRIVALPAPMAAGQYDGTTHVCHPSIGGCNHGFAIVKKAAKP